MSAPYLVIESPSRGVFMGWHHTPVKGEWRPRMSYSVSRTTGRRFYSRAEADKEFDKIRPFIKGQLYYVKLGGGPDAGKILNR